MVLIVAWPLQSLLCFQPRIAHARVDRAESSNFIPDIFSHRLSPVVTHAARDIVNDRHVVTRARWSIERFAHALHATLTVGHGAVGFAPRRTGG